MEINCNKTVSELNLLCPKGSLLTITDTFTGKFGFTANCICSCGNKKSLIVTRFLSGRTKSCGCLIPLIAKQVHTKYYPVNVTIRNAYRAMMCRCYDEDHKTYKDYGGRGVIVCEEWRNDYHKFLDWSLANGWAPKLQLDKDIKGNGLLYSPETCLWVTPKKNANNRRNNVKYLYNGEMLTAPEIARVVGLPIHTVAVRLRKGLNIKDAIKPKKYPLKHYYNGELMTVKEASERFNIKRYLIIQRMRKGFSFEESINLKFRYNVVKK